MVIAACRGQAKRVRGCANHESMREFDRNMPGMCACAGAPMMSSAVLRAAACWNAGAPILISRQPCSNDMHFTGDFMSRFLYSGAAGSAQSFRRNSRRLSSYACYRHRSVFLRARVCLPDTAPAPTSSALTSRTVSFASVRASSTAVVSTASSNVASAIAAPAESSVVHVASSTIAAS
jgi:hypothetical protein